MGFLKRSWQWFAVAFVSISIGNTLYNLIVNRVIYVKYRGWLTYEQAPLHFHTLIIFSSIAAFMLVAIIALLIWARNSAAQRAFRRPPVPLLDETHIARYEGPGPNNIDRNDDSP